MEIEPKQWWPERKDWPEYPAETWTFGDKSYTSRFNTEEAMALLLLDGHVAILNGGDAGTCLQLIVSDTFIYACAEGEPIPPTGFGDDLDKPFWDLYDAIRLHGWQGGVKWAALRRKMKPIEPVVQKLKDAGLWDEELESFKGAYEK